MPFSDVYPALVAKAERKGRTKEEVDSIIYWLTGYDENGLKSQLEKPLTTKRFTAKPRRLTQMPKNKRRRLRRSR